VLSLALIRQRVCGVLLGCECVEVLLRGRPAGVIHGCLDGGDIYRGGQQCGAVVWRSE